MSKILKRYLKEIISLILLLLIGLSISTYITYKQGRDSLSTLHLDKLSIVKNSIAAHISSYFEENEKTLISLSSNGTILNALEDFNKAFKSIETEYKGDFKTLLLETKIKDYISKVNYNVPNASSKKDFNQYIPKSKSAQIIQYEYITKNPFSTSDRYKLYSSNANLSYDKVHKNYQKYFTNELKRYGFYDIFLINLDGDVIYSNCFNTKIPA